MNIVLYFGSFNPIHTAHIAIAQRAAQIESVDEVWLVVSPQNPLKDSSTLAPQQHRYQMASEAIEFVGLKGKVKVSDVEFSMDKPSFTYKTLQKIRSDRPDDNFSIIMGGDNLSNLYRWRNIDEILSSTTIYVYPREGSEVDLTRYKGADVVVLSDAELMDISSTEIRAKRSNNMLEVTENYIKSNGLYV